MMSNEEIKDAVRGLWSFKGLRYTKVNFYEDGTMTLHGNFTPRGLEIVLLANEKLNNSEKSNLYTEWLSLCDENMKRLLKKSE